MPANPQTTWVDLANLGWPKQQVYNALDPKRGNSMQGLGDMALNEGIALQYDWFCYNALKGDLRKDSPVFQLSPQGQTVVWEYDNSANDQPFEDQWTEKWTNQTSVSLDVKTSASITLKESFSIEGICDTELGLTFSTESNESTQTKTSYELAHVFTITVNPHEIVKLVRTQTIRHGTQVCYQDYGLDESQNLIGTKGKKWNGHWYWAWSLNDELNHPTGTIKLLGTSEEISYDFALQRQPAKGAATVEPVAVVHPSSRTVKKEHLTAQVGAKAMAAKKAVQTPIPGIAKESDMEDAE
ncbi:hypothetical protein C8Q80DRAFT_1121036 [Daedaleopsis nitida]|nr:hypothetical protein C8Q80DRAFT_1121036 [Daedaleopsis nitida]